MKMFNLKHKLVQKRALLAGILVLLLTYDLTSDSQPPLSAVEQQLVGQWSSGSSLSTRMFKPDRTFKTDSGQFAGFWHIDKGVLTVRVWEPYEFPRTLSISSLNLYLNSIQRSHLIETYIYKIEFSESGQQHTLNHPLGKEHSDGKSRWTRKTNK